jgi:hypothetical protein
MYRDPFVEQKFQERLDELELETRQQTLRGLNYDELRNAWIGDEESRNASNNHLYVEMELFLEDVFGHWNEVFSRDPFEEELEELFYTLEPNRFQWVEVASRLIKVDQQDLLRLPNSEKEIIEKSFKSHYHPEGKPLSKHNKRLFRRALDRVWKRSSNAKPRGFRSR